MTQDMVIPILPSRDFKETLRFYVALGFTVTYEQHAPYVYGAVERGNIRLHFQAAGHVAQGQESLHTALVVVGDVDALYGAFRAGLKSALGRLPRSGLPRLGTVNSGRSDRRFNLLDPSGNRLIVVQQLGTSSSQGARQASTPLSRAVQAAHLFAHSRDDPELAARRLDKALLNLSTEPGTVRLRAFVLRAEVAAMLGDAATFQRYVQSAQAVTLAPGQAAEVDEALTRLHELGEQHPSSQKEAP